MMIHDVYLFIKQSICGTWICGKWMKNVSIYLQHKWTRNRTQ